MWLGVHQQPHRARRVRVVSRPPRHRRAPAEHVVVAAGRVDLLDGVMAQPQPGRRARYEPRAAMRVDVGARQESGLRRTRPRPRPSSVADQSTVPRRTARRQDAAGPRSARPRAPTPSTAPVAAVVVLRYKSRS
ncbi:unnamed protein product [Urochloa humidicola]